MSWSVNIIGKKADVKAAFNKEQNVPQVLKDTVAAFLDEGKDLPNFGHAVQIKTNGHFGGGYSSISSLSIESINIAPPAPTTT